MRSAALRRLADEVYVGAILLSGIVMIGTVLWAAVRYGIPYALWIGATD
jgi:hypothetical protein